MTEPWFATTHKLRFSDSDPAGHVNNAIYATLFEAGRTELMDAAGMRLLGSAIAMVIVRLEIDFRHEITWPGDVLVETAVARLGNKSIHMRQRIRSGDVVSAEAVSILAAIDRQTRRAIVLDSSWRDRFARWTLPA